MTRVKPPAPFLKGPRLVWVAAALLLACALPALAASEFEQAVFRELNAVRTEPAAFAAHLRRYRALFVGKRYHPPGANYVVNTKEGTVPVDEAIASLDRQVSLAPLKWSEGLARAGAELIREQAKSAETGHGSGDLKMESRLERHGEWTGVIGENITYGPFGSDEGRNVILQLIVDDGVPGRGHRANILSSAFRLAGVACGPRPALEIVCVIDFAGGGE